MKIEFDTQNFKADMESPYSNYQQEKLDIPKFIAFWHKDKGKAFFLISIVFLALHLILETTYAILVRIISNTNILYVVPFETVVLVLYILFVFTSILALISAFIAVVKLTVQTFERKVLYISISYVLIYVTTMLAIRSVILLTKFLI